MRLQSNYYFNFAINYNCESLYLKNPSAELNRQADFFKFISPWIFIHKHLLPQCLQILRQSNRYQQPKQLYVIVSIYFFSILCPSTETHKRIMALTSFPPSKSRGTNIAPMHSAITKRLLESGMSSFWHFGLVFLRCLSSKSYLCHYWHHLFPSSTRNL